MVPIGTLTDIEPTVGPAIISLYNLYPSSNIYGTLQQDIAQAKRIQALEKLASTSAASWYVL